MATQSAVLDTAGVRPAPYNTPVATLPRPLPCWIGVFLASAIVLSLAETPLAAPARVAPPLAAPLLGTPRLEAARPSRHSATQVRAWAGSASKHASGACRRLPTPPSDLANARRVGGGGVYSASGRIAVPYLRRQR